MIYLVKQSLVNSPRIRAMLRPEFGETFEDHVFSEQVRVDTWNSVSARNPGHPWRHMRDLYGKHEGNIIKLPVSVLLGVNTIQI